MYVSTVELFFRSVCRMIRRLDHWLELLPPAEGADIKLMNPTEARQLCTTKDMPATASPPSQVDLLQQPNDHHPVTEMSEDKASGLQDYCSEEVLPPDFPLLPVSRGFHMKLQKLLVQFEKTLTDAGITT